MSEEQLADLKQRISKATDVREKERLQVVLWATTGQYTLDEMATLSGRVRSTIQIWLDDFMEGGITGLVARKSPPGKSSPISNPEVQEQLKEGVKAGKWRTAGQVARWLKTAHGIERAAKSIYPWLGKVGGAPLPRQAGPGGGGGLSR